MRSTSHRPLTVVAILLSMFIAAMEGTVVATAMPTIVSELHGLEVYGWVGALYFLTSTVTIPLWGKLADLLGRKPTMLAGLAIFLLASLACGTASGMLALIVLRGFQGLGAGALQPIPLTMVGDLFTVQERSRIQGVFGAVWGFAGIIGPLLGGFLVHRLSWRWIFYINVPVCLVSALLLMAFYRDPERGRRQHSLDGRGAVLLTLGVLALLLGVGGFAPALSIPVSLVSIACFVWVERRAPEPLLPLDLFGIPAIASGSVCSALTGAVMMGVLMYTPLYAQSVLHTSPTGAGASVAPMMIGWPLASTLGGRFLPRVGYRALVRGGLAIVGLSSLAIWYVASHAVTLAGLELATFGLGAGMGFANIALLIAVQESVDFDRRGVATATNVFFRMIGGTVAVGALGVLVAQAVRDDVSPGMLADLLGPTHGQLLGAQLLASTSAAMQRGMLPVFAVIALLGGLSAIAGLTFPRVSTERAQADPSHAR